MYLVVNQCLVYAYFHQQVTAALFESVCLFVLLLYIPINSYGHVMWVSVARPFIGYLNSYRSMQYI